MFSLIVGPKELSTILISLSLCVSLQSLHSSMAVLFFSVIVLLPLFFLLLLQGRRNKKLNFPPGPPKLPIIGNLHQLGAGAPHRTFYELSKHYGPIMHFQLGSVPALVISSSELAKEVLKTQDAAFCSRPPLVPFRRFFNGSGVATAPYGESWRDLRRMYMHELFSTKKLESYYSVREEEVERMVRSISSDGEVVNMSELMIALNYNIVSRVAYGRSTGDQGDGREYAKKSKFDWLFEEAQEVMVDFFAEDYFPAGRWIDVISGQRRRLDRCAKAVDEFFWGIIGEHMEGSKCGREEDIVDLLLRLHKEGQVTMDQIKGTVMDLFFAGTETSAAAVTWAMTELMRNPSTLKKAQEELRLLLGKKGKVEESDISQLPYLKLVVNEVLRIHPPVPLLVPHEVIQQCKIKNYDVLPKTRVFVNVWAIGREEVSWKDPHEFIPERFEGSSIDFKGQDFQFIPFGSGRRICPGMYFGLASAEIILANLLYIFDWEFPKGMRKEYIDMSETKGISAHKKTKLCLVAKRYI